MAANADRGANVTGRPDRPAGSQDAGGTVARERRPHGWTAPRPLGIRPGTEDNA